VFLLLLWTLEITVDGIATVRFFWGGGGIWHGLKGIGIQKGKNSLYVMVNRRPGKHQLFFALLTLFKYSFTGH
jgi:hypothetical protein